MSAMVATGVFGAVPIPSGVPKLPFDGGIPGCSIGIFLTIVYITWVCCRRVFVLALPAGSSCDGSGGVVRVCVCVLCLCVSFEYPLSPLSL